mmetsp:Transcript_2945/g.4859  ORF Transcript_2945/g.4859 Transcript_2945/m.4859 type:complete len:152 (+) Transcript_2945:114-569(+)
MKTPSTKLFQLVILPKGDVTKPSGMVICCPFTHIIAEGNTFDSALRQWKQRATEKYNCSFSIPSTNKFCTRKVWYSENPHSHDTLFLLDFSKDIPLKPLIIQPSSQLMKEKSEYKDADMGAMFDWKVFCSPIIEMKDALVNNRNPPLISTN